MPKMKYNSVVVFKLGGLGDLLMLTPTIRAYKKSFPEIKINFIVGKSNQGVLKNNPYVDEVHVIDDVKIFRGSLAEKVVEIMKLIRLIRRISPQKIFVLHRDWRWNLISFLSGVEERYGFERDFKGLFLTHAVETSPEEHEIMKYLKVFGMQDKFNNAEIKMDLFPSCQDQENIMRIVGDFFADGKVIAISPGGASNVKEEMDIRRWPIEYYSLFVERILKETDYRIVLIGGKQDIKFTQQLRMDARRIFDLVGKASVQQTYVVLKLCKGLVTHDSGPMHIGAAAGIPVVSLFGSTYPKEKYPITNSKSTFIWKGEELPCSPCYKDGKFPNCRTKKCMYKISVDEVFDRLMEILKSGAK